MVSDGQQPFFFPRPAFSPHHICFDWLVPPSLVGLEVEPSPGPTRKPLCHARHKGPNAGWRSPG